MAIDLDRFYANFHDHPSDRLAVSKHEDAVELSWGPHLDWSGDAVPVANFWVRVAASVAVSVVLAGVIHALSQPPAGMDQAMVVGVAALAVWLPHLWLDFEKHRAGKRRGKLVVERQRLTLEDGNEQVVIPSDELLDVTWTSDARGIQLATTKGLVDLMQGSQVETRRAFARALRSSSFGSPSTDVLLPAVRTLGRITSAEGLDFEREITVQHAWLSTDGAQLYALIGLFVAIGTGALAVVHADPLFVIPAVIVLVLAIWVRGAARESRLRIRSDGSYLIEPVDGQLSSGSLHEVRRAVVTRTGLELGESQSSGEVDAKRTADLQTVLGATLAANREAVKLDFGEDAREGEEDVESSARSEPVVQAADR